MTEAWPERVAEAAGPLVVKEVRQGLRAKVFAICFGLLLMGCVTAALVAFASYDSGYSGRAGKDALSAFLAGLVLVNFFVIPYTAFRSVVREREDETWVLLVLTGLPSQRIVRGKALSALAQSLLYSSAAAPFVLFSYYLNGVDLPTVVLALALLACATVFLIALSIAIATQAATRMGRGVSHLGVLGMLLGATFGGLAAAIGLAQEGSRLIGKPDFLSFCGAAMLAALSSAVVSLEVASNGLALATQQSPHRLKTAVAVQLGIALVYGWWWTEQSGTTSGGAAFVGSMVTSLTLLGAGIFFVSEPDGWRRSERNNSTWKKSGALRSYSFLVFLLFVATAVWTIRFWMMHDINRQKFFVGVLAAPAYVLLYLSLAAFIGRWPLFAKMGEMVATRAALMVLLVGGGVLAPVTSVILTRRADDRILNALNPFLGVVNFVDRYRSDETPTVGAILLVATVVSVLLALATLNSKDKERHA